LKKETRDKIKSMVLNIKSILETEIINIMEGTYGIYKNGKIDDSLNLENLTQDQINKRERLITHIEYLIEGGVKPQDAFMRIIRETAFTILNRLAALRLMDENKIIQESVINGMDSQGFLLFKRISPQLASIDLNNYYNFYLNLIYDELSVDIPILFDRFAVESLILPTIKTIIQIFNYFNQEVPQEIWFQEETIGWIYQYFFTNEKEKFREKRNPRDLPQDAHELIATNQFYTPNYVVRFLIDNSLGRLWKELHPESNIGKYCQLLIEDRHIVRFNSINKDITQIRIIDPACGSGHFLLYAFDVLMEIYKEAIEKGWTSLSNDDINNIPYLIIQKNLFGIDIDKRAIQLTNLTLFLKMKRHNKNLPFPTSNFISVDTILLDNKEKDNLKMELGNKPEINDFIDELWSSLIHSDELGSILNVDQQITNFISKKLLKKPQKKLDIFWNDENKYDTLFFWKKFQNLIIERIKNISSLNIANKDDILKKEFRKSLDFLDLLIKSYDIVIMNPPYGYPTKKGKEYFAKNYPATKQNILCVFIENWTRHLTDNGILGAIVDNTFLVKRQYMKFRQEVLLKEKKLFLGVDLGWGVLDGAQVATIALCLRNRPSDYSCIINLINESEKEVQLSKLIKNNSIDKENNLIFFNENESFLKFPNKAIAYDTPASILRILQSYPPLDPTAVYACQGLANSDAPRFQRYYWEIESSKIGINKKWVPFANGGQFSPYYRPLIEFINYENNGKEIKDLAKKKFKNETRTIKNQKYYFKEGLTWGKRSNILNISHLPPKSIFSSEGQAMFLKNQNNLWYILGVINSKLIQFTLNTYCGQHKHCGYLKLLPFNVKEEFKNKLIENSKLIYESKKRWDEGNQNSPNFKSHWLLNNKQESLIKTIEHTISELQDLDDEVIKLQDENDELTNKIYGLTESEILIIETSVNNRPKTVVWDDMRNTILEQKRKELIESFISYSIGVLLGKWQYPNYILPQINGIIVEDPGNKLDILNLLEKSWNHLFNDSNIIENIQNELGKDFRSYIQSDFFKYHLKRYKNCPIFWQLTIPSKKYSIWINYLLLNREYLLTIKNEILIPKIKFEEEKLANFLKEIADAESHNEKQRVRLQAKEKSDKEKILEELELLNKNLTEIIELDLPFDIDDGVTINIAPFYKLIPWDKPEKIWKKIQEGEFEWSSLSKHLREK